MALVRPAATDQRILHCALGSQGGGGSRASPGTLIGMRLWLFTFNVDCLLQICTLVVQIHFLSGVPAETFPSCGRDNRKLHLNPAPACPVQRTPLTCSITLVGALGWVARACPVRASARALSASSLTAGGGPPRSKARPTAPGSPPAPACPPSLSF